MSVEECSINLTSDDFLNLDVSGVKFKLLTGVLFRYPESLLCQLAMIQKTDGFVKDYHLPKGVIRNDSSNEFLISKSPKLFDDIVLQFYITGKMHVPNSVCRSTLREEMSFWKLDSKYLCSCWMGTEEFVREEEEEAKMNIDNKDKDKNKTMFEKVKNFIWLTCESHTSSCFGMMFAIVSFFFITISTTNLVLQTIPGMRFCDDNVTEQISISDVEDYDISQFLGVEPADNFTVNVTEPLNKTIDSIYDLLINESSTTMKTVLRRDQHEMWSFFSNCAGKFVFEIIDMVCIVWFTFEFLLRFFSCPDKREFMKSGLNIIDCIATFPYYIEVIVFAIAYDAHYLHPSMILVFRLARSLTILRILKLARYFEDLRILGQTLQAAFQELLMLLLFVVLGLLIFASLMYNLEKDLTDTKFRSIPAASWWVVATLTTVGYGDTFPESVVGKLVGCVACITGIMIMSFPASVLVEHFTAAYKKKKLHAVRGAPNSKIPKNNNTPSKAAKKLSHAKRRKSYFVKIDDSTKIMKF